MKRLKKGLLILLALLAIVAVYVLNPRLPVPEDAPSSALYEPGPHTVASESISLTDTTRPTAANGDFEGRDSRQLDGRVWYPQGDDPGPFPLIVYSHGFMSSVEEAGYLVDFLVPHGYVVVAVNYPLSHGDAPGGPNAADVIHQPGDVSHVLDAILARNDDDGDPLHGLIDPSRIAAVGLSLGGLTTQLAAYHAERRDPRIRAAVSIAGPASFLERRFFQSADLPFLMIAGSADAIVPYEANAAPVPSRADNGRLITLEGGSHVGFAGMSSTFLRWFEHPDRLVCPMLLDGLDREDGEAQPLLAPDPEIGISTSVAQPCAMDTWERAMRPGEQQMLTRLAVYAFLERHFAPQSERRQQMEHYLSQALADGHAAVTVQ